ncbi:MAG: putative plasmid stabilization protein ParE [Planctomycetota bacterium]
MERSCWHAVDRNPQPVTRPHQVLTVVVAQRDRRIRVLKKSPFKSIVYRQISRAAAFFAASVRDQTPKLRIFRPRCWAQCIRISPEFSRCHCPTRYRSLRTCGIVFPTPLNRCPSPTGNAVNWISIEDLAEVRRWYEERAVGLGDRFLSQAEDCIRRIQAFPDLYEQVCQGYRRAIVRRFPVWSSMNTPQMGLSSARFFILLRIQKSVGNVCSDRCGKVFEIP